MDSAKRAAAAAADVSSELNRIKRDLQEATGARPQDPARVAAALEAAAEMTRRWPQAAEVFVLAELLGELSEVYEQLARTDVSTSSATARPPVLTSEKQTAEWSITEAASSSAIVSDTRVSRTTDARPGQEEERFAEC